MTVLLVAISAVIMMALLRIAPSGIVMLVVKGWAIAGLLLESVMVVPPAGAWHSSVTRADELSGPTTEVGLSVNDNTPAGRTAIG